MQQSVMYCGGVFCVADIDGPLHATWRVSDVARDQTDSSILGARSSVGHDANECDKP